MFYQYWAICFCFINNEQFAAHVSCCACGGGYKDSSCLDDSAIGVDGVDCDLFTNDPDSCGYSDSQFDSNMMCCACGGGYTRPGKNISHST